MTRLSLLALRLALATIGAGSAHAARHPRTVCAQTLIEGAGTERICAPARGR